MFGALTVEDNLRMGAYAVTDLEEVGRAQGRVVTLFPTLEERRRQWA